MVKLIRLLGNSEQSATEIRNTFREPIILKPNSKVALVGASAYLTDELNNETFSIYSNDNSQYFKIGAPGNEMSAVLTAGDYTAHGLVDEFAIAANYAGTATKGLGLHHQTAIISDHFELTTHKSLYQVNAFTDTELWDYTGTPAAIAAGAITAGTGYLDVFSDIQTSTVPMVHNKFGATLVNVSGSFICSAYDSYNLKYLFGFEVSGGTYYKVINDVHTSLATSWAANDVVVMETYAGGYHLTITSSTGTVKKQEDNLLALPRIWYGPTLQAGFKWQIEMTQSSQISGCYATTVYGAGGQQATLKDVTSNNVLKFAADSGAVNKPLATYVGFGDEAGTDIVYSGNPAVLGGREPMSGLPANSGVLVVLDGLGPLQSFDGAATSRAPDNILYVLNDLTNVNSNVLQIDIPAPFYLDLNNAHPINVNELRARFMPATGYKLNPTLSFSGKPSLTLLIDG
jgi:hypothetical protein